MFILFGFVELYNAVSFRIGRCDIVCFILTLFSNVWQENAQPTKSFSAEELFITGLSFKYMVFLFDCIHKAFAEILQKVSVLTVIDLSRGSKVLLAARIYWLILKTATCAKMSEGWRHSLFWTKLHYARAKLCGPVCVWWIYICCVWIFCIAKYIYKHCTLPYRLDMYHYANIKCVVMFSARLGAYFFFTSN